MIQKETITVSGATGGAGVATATVTAPCAIQGVVLAVYIEYTDTPPAGTVVTIAGASSPAMPILEVTGNTSGWFYPLHPACSSADGSTMSTAETLVGLVIGVFDKIKVTIASANNDDGCVVSIYYEDIR